MSRLGRGTVAALVLTVGALSAVGFGVLWVLRQDRAELVQRFRAEQLAQVRVLAGDVESDLEDINSDLIFTSRLVHGTQSSAERLRALEVLLRVVRPYRLAVMFDPDGRQAEQVVDRATAPAFAPEAFDLLLRSTAARARALPVGEVTSSPAEPVGETAWFRAFATPLPEADPRAPRATLVVLVDTALLLGRLKFPPGAQPVVVNRGGAFAPVTGAFVKHGASRDGAAMRELMERLQAGDAGTSLVPETEAARLGLGNAELVVAFAPARAMSETLWTIGAVTSTAALETQERALLARLGVVSASIFVCILAFAAWMVRASRREVAVREQLRHAEQVASLTSQLMQAEKLATVGMLAAGIAHEIGTPLGVVRARAELLAARLGDASTLTAGALIIVEQIDRVTRTIRQLLTFSQPQPAEVSAVSVASSARQVVDLLQYEASSRHVALDVDIATEVPPLAANADQLQQVLVNLVLNACDACDAAAKNGRVTIRASTRLEAPGVANIQVSDNGCGVPPEMRHRVFDPFFTTKKRGKGTGLGLTVAAQIVRNHGGHIELDSTPGQGTRVNVAWPTQPPRGERHNGTNS